MEAVAVKVVGEEYICILDRRHLEELAPALIKIGLGLFFGGALLAGFDYYALQNEGIRDALFAHSYLAAASFGLSIALGGLFFVIVHHLAKVGWSVVVRRIAEGIAGNVLLMGLLFVPLFFFGMDLLYGQWLDPDHYKHPTTGESLPAVLQHHIHEKHAFLNKGFFGLRLAIYLVIWAGLAFFFFNTSKSQDKQSNDGASRRMQFFSAPSMALFALSLTFFAFDWLMSLNPTWYSTIFGVYYFAGSVGSFFAFLALACWWLQRNNRLTTAISPEHFQDIGKFTFAFVVFWAYIAFSQYMLIWYGSIPEETTFYRPHHDIAGWKGASWFLIIGHFFFPFVAIMSRNIKRRTTYLAMGAGWMLFMHWFDMFWVVMPRLYPTELPQSWMTIGLGVAVFGLFIAGFAFNLRKCSLIAENDPRLRESLAFENI